MKVKVKSNLVVRQLDHCERAGLSIDLGRCSRDPEQNFHWLSGLARPARPALGNTLSNWLVIG